MEAAKRSRIDHTHRTQGVKIRVTGEAKSTRVDEGVTGYEIVVSDVETALSATSLEWNHKT